MNRKKIQHIYLFVISMPPSIWNRITMMHRYNPIAIFSSIKSSEQEEEALVPIQPMGGQFPIPIDHNPIPIKVTVRGEIGHPEPGRWPAEINIQYRKGNFRGKGVSNEWYDLRNTPPDGDCMFHALGMSWNMGQVPRGFLRNELCKAVQKRTMVSSIPMDRYKLLYGENSTAYAMAQLASVLFDDLVSQSETVFDVKNCICVPSVYNCDAFDYALVIMAVLMERDILCISKHSANDPPVWVLWLASEESQTRGLPIVVYHENNHYSGAIHRIVE